MSGEATKQRGASILEFALVAPLFIMILFSLVEFSWVFYQTLDTRHGAREAARLIAVNYSPNINSGIDQRDDLIEEICARIEEPAQTRVGFELEVPGSSSSGALARVRVERDLEQLTGFFGEFLSNVEPSSEVAFRLERDATWTPTTTPLACP